MSEIKVIDARGLSCPQPVMLTRKALQEAGKGTVEVLVDTSTSRDNVSRAATSSGWKVAIEQQPEGSYRIVLKK